LGDGDLSDAPIFPENEVEPEIEVISEKDKTLVILTSPRQDPVSLNQPSSTETLTEDVLANNELNQHPSIL
jgi:hypothetical protein